MGSCSQYYIAIRYSVIIVSSPEFRRKLMWSIRGVCLVSLAVLWGVAVESMIRLEAWDASPIQRYKAPNPLWQIPFLAIMPISILVGAGLSLKAAFNQDPLYVPQSCDSWSLPWRLTRAHVAQ